MSITNNMNTEFIFTSEEKAVVGFKKYCLEPDKNREQSQTIDFIFHFNRYV